MTLYDRIYGCLLGGACGDALGAPVEFLALDEILAEYGPDGITEFDDVDGILGAITDDTQMALFTVEGLIRAWVRGATKGICHIPSVVHHAYHRWLVTQDEDLSHLRSNDKLDGWLIRDKRLWARRAPGETCLSSLRVDTAFGETAMNNSKGCGTVMRDAPFGFIAVDNPTRALELAAETASTTHGHPSASCSSGALASIIAFVCQGRDLREAVEHTLPLLQTRPEAHEVLDALENVLRLSETADWRERLPELGEGWVAEEALAISVLCALAADNPREAIIAAVNHSGDSDSTGAITGNIVGAAHGAASLPATWVQQVELRDVIQILAKDLAGALESNIDPEVLSSRYPGW